MKNWGQLSKKEKWFGSIGLVLVLFVVLVLVIVVSSPSDITNNETASVKGESEQVAQQIESKIEEPGEVEEKKEGEKREEEKPRPPAPKPQPQPAQQNTDTTNQETLGETTSEPSHTPKYINVRYRSGSVDIANPRFEYLDTSRSSLIRGAWYDEESLYMIINLSGVYYDYCGLPKSVWLFFKTADSFGSDYNQFIKGRYYC